MSVFIKLFPNPAVVDVLILFVLHPDKEIYQASVVESTGKALMQVQRALKRIEEAGLITKERVGNRIYYKANRMHPAFEDIKRALFKTVIIGDALKKKLDFLKSKILYCFIYGSTARAEERSSSDIDLFLIGNLGLRDVASMLGSIREELGREVNPTVYSINEFKNKLKERNIFITTIIQEPKIWLTGDENEFKKMAQ